MPEEAELARHVEDAALDGHPQVPRVVAADIQVVVGDESAGLHVAHRLLPAEPAVVAVDVEAVVRGGHGATGDDNDVRHARNRGSVRPRPGERPVEDRIPAETQRRASLDVDFPDVSRSAGEIRKATEEDHARRSERAAGDRRARLLSDQDSRRLVQAGERSAGLHKRAPSQGGLLDQAEEQCATGDHLAIGNRQKSGLSHTAGVIRTGNAELIRHAEESSVHAHLARGVLLRVVRTRNPQPRVPAARDSDVEVRLSADNMEESKRAR